MFRLSSHLLSVLLLIAVSGCTQLARNQNVGLDAPKIGANSTVIAFQADASFADALDRLGRKKVGEAEQAALNNSVPGERVSWKYQQDQASGWVAALQFFKVGNRSCRRVQHQAQVKGVSKAINVTACKSPGQVWSLVE